MNKYMLDRYLRTVSYNVLVFQNPLTQEQYNNIVSRVDAWVKTVQSQYNEFNPNVRVRK